MEPSGGLSIAYRCKRLFSGTALKGFGLAVQWLSRRGQKLRREIADWEDGRVFALGVWPDGPFMVVQKRGLTLRYMGADASNAALTILFKNLDALLLVFTGRMGTHTAFAQHRAILHGSIAEAMEVSRALEIGQLYVFPRFILRKTLKRMPVMTAHDKSLKLGLIPAVGISWLKYAVTGSR